MYLKIFALVDVLFTKGLFGATMLFINPEFDLSIVVLNPSKCYVRHTENNKRRAFQWEFFSVYISMREICIEVEFIVKSRPPDYGGAWLC